MCSHSCWGGVVTRNCEHRWLELHQPAQLAVDLFDDGRLPCKVPVFTSAVGSLDVNEGEIKVFPSGAEGGKFLGRAFTLKFKDLHADQFGGASVHRISRNACRIQAVTRTELRQFGIGREPSQGQPVGLRLIGQHRMRVRDPSIEHLG